MKIIGITGGVGSGKSTITKLLEEQFNSYSISCDAIAHRLMSYGNVSYQLIKDYFGSNIIKENKEIDRIKLGKIVYEDKEKLNMLNSFTHPYVMEYVKNEIESVKNQFRLVTVETALPVEAKLHTFCDEIWYVDAPIRVRKQRLMESRGYSSEKIESIMSKQIRGEQFKQISTHILYNDGNLENILMQLQVLVENSHEI